MNQTNYPVMPASPEQRQYIFDNLLTSEYYQKYQESSIIFVSVDESGKIIGRIVARATDDALNSWYIDNLRVHDDYKRCGIGTELFRELQKAALSEGVKDLHGFAEATVEASRFWESLGFCLLKIGTVHADGANFGNYAHYMFRSPENLTHSIGTAASPFGIVRADPSTRKRIIEDYLYPINKPYFEKLQHDLFGFAALDENGRIVGFAVMKHEPLYPPFTEMTLCFWVHVVPELRRRGIGTTLVREVLSYADGIGVSQVIHPGGDESELPFWAHLNFHVHIHGKSAANPTRSVILVGTHIDK